jgi:tetratricopeptide (TPR) repeat protein
MEQIRAMLVDDPDDVFLNYALALELDKAGQHEESLELFRRLTGSEAPYVPACFMAAQMLNRLGRNEEATRFLEDGILIARKQGNAHAVAEMTEFLEMLCDD